MPDDNHKRLSVHRKLTAIAGEPEADYMMELFSNHDVDSQMAALRAEMQIELAGIRTDMVDRLAAIRTDMATGFAEIDGRFAELEGRFAQIDGRFAGIDTKFARVDTRLAELRAEMHQGFRTQTVTMIVTMLTLAGVIVAALAVAS